MPKANVGDINIYYEAHGSGEALALIMGLGGGLPWLFRQVPSFSKEYRVVAFDNRGTGGSDAPDIPYTMEMMAGDSPACWKPSVPKLHIFSGFPWVV